MPSAADRGVVWVGFGHCLPERIVGNAEIEADLQLPPGWIESRTGIRTRHYAAPDQALSDLAVPAGAMALAGAGETGRRVGLLLLATSTPDHLLPPTAPLVAHRLGLTCGAVDVAGACAGFLHALALGAAHCRATGTPVLVVGANILSRRINPSDRATRALFADAAAAILLAPCNDPERGLIGCDLGSDGAGYGLIQVPRGGSRAPCDGSASGLHMQMPDGRAVFGAAVDAIVSSGRAALRQAGLEACDIALWLPHQANRRIIERAGDALGLRHAPWLGTLASHGNSSSATIPLALSHHVAAGGRIGSRPMLLSAFGAGTIRASLVWQP